MCSVVFPPYVGIPFAQEASGLVDSLVMFRFYFCSENGAILNKRVYK